MKKIKMVNIALLSPSCSRKSNILVDLKTNNHNIKNINEYESDLKRKIKNE